ncbi:MAG: phosphatase PAP2 family protein [Phycisphaerales bacterium]
MTKSKYNKIRYFVVISIVLFALLALYSYLYADVHVSSFFQKHDQLEKIPGMNLIRPIGKSYVPLWLIFICGFLKKRIEIILTGAISMLLVLAIVSPAKIIIERERPYTYFKTQTPNVQQSSHLDIFYKSSSQSFPSGDTATIFAIVVAVSPFISRFSFLNLLIIAALVGYLRVVDLAHYVSDVFAGAIIGVFCGWLGIMICQQWMKRNKFPFGQGWRNIAAVGIFLIPTLVVFEGFEDFSLFIGSSIILAGWFFSALNVWPIFKLKLSSPK